MSRYDDACFAGRSNGMVIPPDFVLRANVIDRRL